MSKHVIITYYTDGTEQVQDTRDEESAKVSYLLQLDTMKDTPKFIERVRRAIIVQDSE